MKPKFESTQNGLVIIDPIERKQWPIKTDTAVVPTSGGEERIPFPMDSTAEITTSGMSLPDNVPLYIRDSDGTLCREVEPGENISLPKDNHILDFHDPLKIYVHVNSGIRIQVGIGHTEISFEEPTRITISARSSHQRPAETITTTADPTDVMQAVSMFGSALKTITQKRSYPTLRGHPPALEIGNKLSIPDGLNRPQTGIKIEVPPTLRYVFIIAPLVYYLGAKVVPGLPPQLVTETGYTQRLDSEGGFEATVERVLKRIFFLDCIVQTEGGTPGPLYERQAIEPTLKFDIKKLYEQSVAKQLETYLEVPFDTIEPQVPPWFPEVHLEPTTKSIEFLPFVANDLASIKISKFPDSSMSEKEHQTSKKPTPIGVASKHIQSKGTTNDSIVNHRRPNPVIHQCWKNSEGVEITSKKPLSAFRNNITQSPREGPLKIEVVCNDPNMNEELVAVHSTYREGSDVPFDITVHHDLSRKDLRRVFTKESDFLHYIGHIDADGFRCSDGTVDAGNLESAGTKSFFLNACRSYEQGLSLIEAGSIGGIATTTEVENSPAVTIGSTIAQLLNSGIPLYATLQILQQTTRNNHQYQLLGDGSLTVSHADIGIPIFVKIAKDSSGYKTTIIPHSTSRMEAGSVYNIHMSRSEHHHLIPKNVTFRQVPKAELFSLFKKEKIPVLFEDELRWSTEIKTSEL